MNEGAQPAKKGMGPLAWIAIGCVGVILLGIVAVGVGGFFVAKKGKEFVEEMEDNPAKKMAEMAIKMNPDTDFIESDEETVTFEKDGERMTLSFADIQDGKFSVTGPDGATSNIAIGPGGVSGTTDGEDGEEVNFNIFGGGGDTSNVPDVLLFPDADNVNPTVASRSNGQYSGMLNYSSDGSMDDLVEWQGEALGGECNLSRTDVMGTRNATFECGGGNSVNMTFMGQDGSLNVMVNYSLADGS